MTEDPAAKPLSAEQYLADLRRRNARLVRTMMAMAGLVLACGLGWRAIRDASDEAERRPPQARLVTNQIPGYYSEEEVAGFIRPGMAFSVVADKFGPPISTEDRGKEGSLHTWAAFNYPRDRGYEYAFCGFHVRETNGIVIRWGSIHVFTQ